MKQLDQLTSQVPLIGQFSPELVLIILIALIAILIFIPLAFIYLP
jgi:hypothetical protein